MPPRPLVPNVAQVVVSGKIGGTYNWVNKLFVRYSGAAPIGLDLDSYAAGLMADWIANLTPLQALNNTIEEIEVTDLSSIIGAVGVSAGTTNGTLAGDKLPGDAAALVSYKIARHYRGGHPRTYLVVGDATKLTTPYSWTGLFVTGIEAAWASFQAALIVAYGTFSPSEQVNVSYVTGGAARLVPVVDQIVVASTAVSPRLASQRRRIGRK
jgi:hypothetical protein